MTRLARVGQGGVVEGVGSAVIEIQGSCTSFPSSAER